MKSDEIDLMVYVRIIRKYFLFVFLFVTVITGLATWYSYSNYVPIYLAQTKMIVNDGGEADAFDQQAMDIGVLQKNSGLIDTYKEIIRTPIIMDKVVARFPNLGVSSEYLMSIVNVYALNNTQVMIISATDYSHERAVLIVNAITDVFRSEIPNISKGTNVVVLTEAKLLGNPQPINEKQNKFIIFGFVASFFLSAGAAIVLESLDDRLKTEKDVRQILGIPVLSTIPKSKRKANMTIKKARREAYVTAKSKTSNGIS